MLVIEEGNNAPAFPEYSHDLVEESLARIFHLCFGIDRIISKFSDGKHGVHGKVASATTERFRNGSINRNLVSCGNGARQIMSWNLIDIHAGNFHVGRNQSAVEQIGFQKVFENDVSVAAVSVFGDDGRDAQAFALGCKR